jgi:hypothetical protein
MVSLGSMENGMVDGIARANIGYYKKLLATEKDEAKRKVLLQRLAEQEQKLAAALEQKNKPTK